MNQKSESDRVLGRRCRLCGCTRPRRLYPLEDFSVVRCPECGLVFLEIDLGAEKIKEMYSGDYYENRADYFFDNPVLNKGRDEEDTSIRNFRHGLELVKVHHPDAGNRLLDVGCAVGVFMTLARDEGWEVSGVDISDFAAGYCREKLGLDAHAAGNLAEAGFEPESFDVITLWDVLEHFEDPLSQLREVNRLLKPGGVMLVDTPNQGSLIRSVAHFLYRISGGLVDLPVRKLYHQFHLYYFDTATLGRLLEEAGFQLVHLEGRPIPDEKGRAGFLGRLAVKAISIPERLLHREFELLAVARKPVAQMKP